MRKFAVLAVTAASLFAFVAIALAADNHQTISVKLTKTNAGTTARPASTGLNVKLANTGTDPAPAHRVIIFFDKNLVFNGASFPKCTLTKATQNRCPANTKVGTGLAVAQAGTSKIPLKITAFNGATGHSLLLALRGALAVNLEAKLLKGSGLYGTKLVTNVPKGSYNGAPGFYTPLVQFDTLIPARTTRVRGKTVPYIALVGCTARKLRFKTQFEYVARTDVAGNVTKPKPPNATPTATAACTK